MGDVDRSMPYNCQQVHGIKGFHSIRSENMKNIFPIKKWKYCCFCLTFIDDKESINQCVNHNNKYVKPWIHEELIPLHPHPRFTDEEMDNDFSMIDKDYDCLSNMVIEGDVFIVIELEYNPEKVHYYLLQCTKLKKTLIRDFKDYLNYTYQFVQWG